MKKGYFLSLGSQRQTEFSAIAERSAIVYMLNHHQPYFVTTFRFYQHLHAKLFCAFSDFITVSMVYHNIPYKCKTWPLTALMIVLNTKHYANRFICLENNLCCLVPNLQKERH